MMVKSGDRSDKIRTYNFPQNRVTDHRIGLTLYNLAEIIDGKLDELLEAAEDRRQGGEAEERRNEGLRLRHLRASRSSPCRSLTFAKNS